MSDDDKDRKSFDERLPSKVRDLWKSASSSLGFYVAIECVWHVSLFAACYRYRPMVKLGNTRFGKQIIDQVNQRFHTIGGGASRQAFRERLSKVVRKVPGGQRTVVAASEWFFFNKAIGIPLWPTKLLLAGWLGAKLEEYQVQKKLKAYQAQIEDYVGGNTDDVENEKKEEKAQDVKSATKCN